MPEGYQTGFDQVLNFLVPTLLILGVVAFIYFKLLKPWGLDESIKGMFTGKKDENKHVAKEIVYD